ncbi:MAG: hypothetical protein WDA11_00560 [Thiohalomonadaceae bacterium]
MDEKLHLALTVECHAGHGGEETPHRLRIGARVIEVMEVVDRWYEPAHRYFKLRGSDGGLYIVHHDDRTDTWQLVIYDSDTRSESRLSSSSHSPDSVK